MITTDKTSQITDTILSKFSEVELLEKISQAMQGVGPIAHHRMELHTSGFITVIDDAYNANPDSMRAALDALKQISCNKLAKSIAILGDMLELGEVAVREHIEIGQYAREVAKVDEIIGIGELAKYYNADKYFANISDLKLLDNTENVVYLLKASSASKLWEVIDQLIK